MLKIIKYPDTFLRKASQPINRFDGDLKEMAMAMAQTMYTDDGIGLAGPQVGLSQQIVVMGDRNGHSYTVYVNPEVTFFSKDKTVTEEGCLSLPQIFGLVRRSKQIHIKYKDLDGQSHKEKIKGFQAIVLQHEIDHLNGILFIDRAERITKGQEILDKLKND